MRRLRRNNKIQNRPKNISRKKKIDSTEQGPSTSVSGRMATSKEKTAEIDEYLKNNLDEPSISVAKKLGTNKTFVNRRRKL